MKKNLKKKYIYLGNLIAQRKLMVFIFLFACILLAIVTNLSEKNEYAKENGEKISGVVSNIIEYR